MEIIVVRNYEEASDKAFEIMKDIVVSNPKATLGLATGSTPLGLYQRMIKDCKENNTTYKEIKTFNLDEYFGLDSTHPQSYFTFMYENLFKDIDIDINNTHVPKGTGDIQANCDEYNQLLSENRVDIQLLGIGGNGHIGFNEPGTSFDSVTHYIELDQRTREDNARLFFDGNINEVPTDAITMGIKNILDAKKVLLIACGKNKADAIKEMIEDQPTTKLPASALKHHKDVIVIIDEEAASKLTK